MSPATLIAPATGVGTRKTVGRYTLPSGGRVIYRERAGDEIRLVDMPATGEGGESWIIESGLEQDPGGAIDALVIDYLGQAKLHQTIPASTAAVHSLL